MMSYVHDMMSYVYMMSYMMSCANDIICLVYDILYDIFTYSARFPCGPGPVSMRPGPRAGSNATRFESNAGGPACPLRLSQCLPRFWHQNRVAVVYYTISGTECTSPPGPPLSPILIDCFATPLLLGLGSCLSDFGASLYHSTSLRLIISVP